MSAASGVSSVTSSLSEKYSSLLELEISSSTSSPIKSGTSSSGTTFSALLCSSVTSSSKSCGLSSKLTIGTSSASSVSAVSGVSSVVSSLFAKYSSLFELAISSSTFSLIKSGTSSSGATLSGWLSSSVLPYSFKPLSP